MISTFQVILLTVSLSSLKQISSHPAGKTPQPDLKLDKSASTLSEVIGPRINDGVLVNSEENPVIEPIDESTRQSKESSVNRPTNESQVKTAETSKETVTSYDQSTTSKIDGGSVNLEEIPVIESIDESSVNKPTIQDDTQVKTAEGIKETITNYEQPTSSTVNENIGDIKDTLDVMGYDEDATDELVYAEDPVYKEYNLNLYIPDTVESSGSISAATLITALGLPATSSFVQALLTAYSLPNGPSLVEDLLSKLLLIDDNMLVYIVQSLGKDGLENQGLTLNEFKDFLLDDDNETLNLMMRLFIDATKGNKLVNVQLDNLPLKQVDHFPNFEIENDIHDDPIIYTPFQEQIPTRRQPFSQRPIQQPLAFNRIPPTSQQKPHNFQHFQGQIPNPGQTYFFSPQPDYDPKMKSFPSQPVNNFQPPNKFLDNNLSNRNSNFRNPQIHHITNFGQSPVPTQLDSAVPRGQNNVHAPMNDRFHQQTASQHSPPETHPIPSSFQQYPEHHRQSQRHPSNDSRNTPVKDSSNQAKNSHNVIQPREDTSSIRRST